MRKLCIKSCIFRDLKERTVLGTAMKLALLAFLSPLLLVAVAEAAAAPAAAAAAASTTESCNPQLPTGNCPASHDVGPLPDPDDCTAFWMCYDGCAVKEQVVNILHCPKS